MELQEHHYLYPKQGCKPSECEDGFAIHLPNLRFCVSDGASDAFDSRSWARLLAANWKLNVKGFPFDIEQFQIEVQNLSQRWKEKWFGRELPWYKEAKASKGAFSSFLGVELELDGKSIKWKAIAVGDCCLFTGSSKSHILNSFPIKSSDEFGNNPFLIATVNQEGLSDNIKTEEGELSADNFLLLMSDAMSSWYFRASEENAHEFLQSVQGNHRSALEKLIEDERNNHSLRNDDIAIISIRAK